METPISTLLSQVLIAHTIELDNEFEHRFRQAGGGARVTSLVIWSNHLRFVVGGSTVRDLVEAFGVPKRSALSRIGALERWGYVSVGSSQGRREGYGSGRALKDGWSVELTPAGRSAASIWPELPHVIESRWRTRFGSDIEQLTRALRTLDEEIGTPLPDFLPIVSSGDGLALDPGSRSARLRREQPLVVLLAHALMAYTLEFDEGSPLSLALSANVFRVLVENGVQVRDLPSLTGISKEAVEVSLTSLKRTEYVSIEGAPASRRTVRLTPAGSRLREEQGRLHARIERRWRERFGKDVVQDVRAILGRILDDPELTTGTAPYADGWRASRPYVRQTEALLADPRGSLPHHPMVLHRGGWPDGS